MHQQVSVNSLNAYFGFQSEQILWSGECLKDGIMKNPKHCSTVVLCSGLWRKEASYPPLPDGSLLSLHSKVQLLWKQVLLLQKSTKACKSSYLHQYYSTFSIRQYSSKIVLSKQRHSEETLFQYMGQLCSSLVSRYTMKPFWALISKALYPLLQNHHW